MMRSPTECLVDRATFASAATTPKPLLAKLRARDGHDARSAFTEPNYPYLGWLPRGVEV
jgi:hypothetical protein